MNGDTAMGSVWVSSFNTNVDGPGGYHACEISQRKTNTVHDHLCVESKKENKQMNKHKRNRYREQSSGYHWEEGRGRGKTEIWD